MKERGQVTVLVLGLSVLAFAVAGLAVDGTRAWLLRRTLQNAADAAALAGAGELDASAFYRSGGSELELDPGRGRSTATSWLADRGVTARVAVVTTDETVTVELRGEVTTTFLGLVGVEAIPVLVRAEAAPR